MASPAEATNAWWRFWNFFGVRTEPYVPAGPLGDAGGELTSPEEPQPTADRGDTPDVQDAAGTSPPAPDRTPDISAEPDRAPDPDSPMTEALVQWIPSPGPPPTLGAPTMGDATGQMTLTDWYTLPRISADGGLLGSYQIRAASIAGRGHTQNGDTCQDSYACTQADDGTVVLAIADGLGHPRYRFSSVGARHAVVTACRIGRTMADAGQRPVPRLVAQQVSTSLDDYAHQTQGITPEDLRTTLVLCWLYPSGQFLVMSVGDSGAATLDPEQAGWMPLFPGGGFVNQVNDSLPSQQPEIASAQGQLQPGGALLLATDGLLLPLGAAEVNGHLAECWREPPELLDFVRDLDFRRRGESDDRTALCAWFRPET
jgi:serine/threonine protein phosphatase PrpC